MTFTYKIFNSSLEKYYYGYTTNPEVRKGIHFNDLKSKRHHCKKLQEEFNNNPEGWEFSIDKIFNTEEDGLVFEKQFIFNNKENLLNSSIPIKKRNKLFWKNGNGSGGKKKSQNLFNIGDKIKFKEYDYLNILDITSTQYLVEENGNIFSIYNILAHKYGCLI